MQQLFQTHILEMASDPTILVDLVAVEMKENYSAALGHPIPLDIIPADQETTQEQDVMVCS